jgi:hydroxylysine kinase
MPTDAAAVTLSNPPEPIAVEAVVEILERHYGLRAEVAELRGERDSNFLVHTDGIPTHVLRVANSREPRVIADFRAAELAYIAESAADLPVPRIQPTRDGHHGFEWEHSGWSRFGQLVTYLPGTPMAAAPGASNTLRQLGSVAARMASALVGFDHEGARLPLLWDISQAGSAAHYRQHTTEGEQSELVEWAIRGFAEAQPVLATLRHQVIHNDLNPHNIMISDTDDVAGIIDFGDSVYSALVNDVAVACSYLTFDEGEPLREIVQFLAAYCEVNALSEDELAVLPKLIATRHALTIVITNWRAAKFPENAAYILRNQPTSLRGLRGLSRLPPEQAVERMLAAGTRGRS